MKLRASTQNVLSMNTAWPLVGQWEKGGSRRASLTVRPFGFEDVQQSVSHRDELARKSEFVCAVILGLCLLSTFAVCLGELAFL